MLREFHPDLLPQQFFNAPTFLKKLVAKSLLKAWLV